MRALACLIGDVGILTRTGRYMLSRIVDHWEASMSSVGIFLRAWRSVCNFFGGQADDDERRFNATLDRMENFEMRIANVNVKVCAVWDSVASVGVTTRLLPRLLSRQLGAIRSRPCDNVENAFQALALDERRYQFQPEVCVE